MTEQPPHDPYEFGWLDGPSRAAEDEAYLSQKQREYQEEELREIEREEVARAGRDGALEDAAAVLVRAALAGRKGPANQERMAKLLAHEGGPEAFARVVTLLLRAYATQNPLEALELTEYLETIVGLTFREVDEGARE